MTGRKEGRKEGREGQASADPQVNLETLRPLLLEQARTDTATGGRARAARSLQREAPARKITSDLLVRFLQPFLKDPDVHGFGTSFRRAHARLMQRASPTTSGAARLSQISNLQKKYRRQQRSQCCFLPQATSFPATQHQQVQHGSTAVPTTLDQMEKASAKPPNHPSTPRFQRAAGWRSSLGSIC